MSTINCLLVDTQSIFRAGLKSYFEHASDLTISVTGEETTAEGLILFLHKNLSTELVLLDLNLPDQDGLEVIPQIKKQFKQVKILVLTSYSAVSYTHLTLPTKA